MEATRGVEAEGGGSTIREVEGGVIKYRKTKKSAHIRIEN